MVVVFGVSLVGSVLLEARGSALQLRLYVLGEVAPVGKVSIVRYSIIHTAVPKLWALSSMNLKAPRCSCFFESWSLGFEGLER